MPFKMTITTKTESLDTKQTNTVRIEDAEISVKDTEFLNILRVALDRPAPEKFIPDTKELNIDRSYFVELSDDDFDNILAAAPDYTLEETEEK